MYIVTGGAGFIGSAVVWGLNQRGIDDILIVDHLGTSDKWKNLRALKYSDYIEKELFRHLISHEDPFQDDVDAIIHLGACSATTERNASYLVDNNYQYSIDVAEYAVANDVRLVYASSAATYGDGSQGYLDDEEQLETLRPMNMYGYSKQMFDLWARRNQILDRVTGLKFTNIFGPNEGHKDNMRSVMHRAFSQIQEEGKLRLFKSYRDDYADGEQMRDFLYVKDAVNMLLYIMDEGITGIFNIGSGKAETWNAVAKAAFVALDKPCQIEYIDMPEDLIDRYQYYTKADMEKLHNAGYEEETTTLKDAIKDYYQNYLLPEKHLGDEG